MTMLPINSLSCDTVPIECAHGRMARYSRLGGALPSKQLGANQKHRTHGSDKGRSTEAEPQPYFARRRPAIRSRHSNWKRTQGEPFCSPAYLPHFPRSASRSELARGTSRRESQKQPTGKSSLEYGAAKLRRSRAAWDLGAWRAHQYEQAERKRGSRNPGALAGRRVHKGACGGVWGSSFQRAADYARSDLETSNRLAGLRHPKGALWA